MFYWINIINKSVKGENWTGSCMKVNDNDNHMI